MHDVKIGFLCLLVNAVCFYGAMLLISNTGMGMLILLIILPVITLLISFLYGFLVQKQLFLYAVLSGLLFIPAIWIFMNDSARIYAVAYGVIAALGGCFGKFMKKIKTAQL